MTTRPDPFKSPRPSRGPVVPVDPRQNIEQHGIHGDRLAPASRRIVMIPIERIRPGRYQKRETVNAEKYQQLKDQIKELGLNFVAIVCVDPDDNNFYNLLMGGHLRTQAARELGIAEVSAIIRDYDQEAMAKGTYFENNGRQPLTLIEEGLIFKQLQDDKKWTQEEIAEKLLVPGGRSHVALCLLTVTAPPDIQEMLRHDPRRGSRCFYYLRQLDELGEEKAIRLRAPIIHDFLLGKISTDEVKILVQQILQREQGEVVQDISFDEARRQNKIATTVKTFQRFEKEIGIGAPSVAERETLLDLKQKIESILERD